MGTAGQFVNHRQPAAQARNDSRPTLLALRAEVTHRPAVGRWDGIALFRGAVGKQDSVRESGYTSHRALRWVNRGGIVGPLTDRRYAPRGDTHGMGVPEWHRQHALPLNCPYVLNSSAPEVEEANGGGGRRWLAGDFGIRWSCSCFRIAGPRHSVSHRRVMPVLWRRSNPRTRSFGRVA
jgi:hypothetical protein